MSDLSQDAPPLRKATIEDFFDCDVENTTQHHEHNYNYEYIQKNQQHYGPRKRIKP